MSESQDDASIEEVTIDEAIFLYHIDQLKRAEREDICRIATVLLEAHRIIRHKFRQLQVRRPCPAGQCRRPGPAIAVFISR